MYQRKTTKFTQACGFHEKKHQKLQKKKHPSEDLQLTTGWCIKKRLEQAITRGLNFRHAALTIGCMCACEPVCVPFLVTAVSVLSSVQDLLTSCNFSIQFQKVFDTYFTWLFGLKSTSMKE